MGHSLEEARALARHPAVRVGAIALLGAGVACGGLPLLEAPGYELGEATALLASVLAPLLGIAAARAELRRAGPSPLAAWLSAALVLGGLAGAAVLGAATRAAFGPCAALGRALWWVPLLAGPSVLLGASLAVAAGFAARGRAALAGLLYVLAAAASLALSLRDAYRGPAAFVFDPLLGAWPGPIYDEVLLPDLRAVLLRGAALAGAVGVVAAAEALARAARAGLRAAAGPALAALLAVGAARTGGAGLEALGLSGSRAALGRALGAVRAGPRCTLVLPAERPAAAAEGLLADCEFHVADLSRILGIPPPPRVVVYVYRSAEEKRRLVGAGATEYAKPWLGEVHLVDAPLPHPLLRHELVHVLAARVAGGPLGVPARDGILVSAGLVEGLAAALETPRGQWTVHEWSRAARELGLLPDVAALVGPAGFYAQPPARAYTAAGSFLAYLLERHGAAPIRAAYRTGDVAGSFGVPLHALVDGWLAYLDRVEVPPGLLAAARARLGRGSIFARPCAREVAQLEGRAAAAAAVGRTADACALYAAAGARSGDPWTRKAEGDARARAGDLAGAAAAYRAAAERAGADAALRAGIAAAEGDLAWRRDELAEAASSWSAALSTHPDRGEARLLAAKLVAAASPTLGPAARPYLLGDGDPAVALARVAREQDPLAAYLVGRALATRGEWAPAVPELERAAAGRLPPSLSREAELLLGTSACASGRRAAGAAALRAVAGPGASAADRARSEEGLRRCEVSVAP